MDGNSSGKYDKSERRAVNRGGPAWRRSSAQRAFPQASSIPFSFGAASHGQPRRRGRRSAGRSPLGVSKSEKLRRPLTILDMAHANRNKCCTHASPEYGVPSSDRRGLTEEQE